MQSITGSRVKVLPEYSDPPRNLSFDTDRRQFDDQVEAISHGHNLHTERLSPQY